VDVCADCGLPIEWYPPKNRWGSKIADNGTTDVWVFTCRVERQRGIIVAADYHAPASEPQAHYRIGRP
jgi:hypothetical protein